MKRRHFFGKNRVGFWPAVAVLPLCWAGCFAFLDPRKALAFDFKPPVLVDWKVRSATEVGLTFSEPIEVLSVADGVQATATEGELQLLYRTPMAPGERVQAFVSVEDRSKNRLELVLTFYGYNPRVPQLVMNEIRLRRSGKKGDAVEFYVTEGGDLAGVTFYRGVPGNYDFNYIFPKREVAAGDYVVLHLEPTGAAEEKNELHDKGESGGSEATETAWDFWLPAKEGLSETNGVLTVCDSPGGEILDAFAYSNRTSLSDTNYRGFGSFSHLLRVETLFDCGAWVPEAGSPDGEAKIRPEDCMNPAGQTATRTLNRKNWDGECIDTNQAKDWFVAGNGGNTIGLPNSRNCYQP